MDRRWLLVGAGVVLVAAVLLIRMLRGGGDTPETGVTTTPTPTPSTSTSTTAAERPALPDRENPQGTPVVSETTTDRVRVRDHRTGAAADEPAPRTPRTSGARVQRLAPALVHDLNGKLQLALKTCGAAIPETARGTRPQVTGTLHVDITAGVLRVAEVADLQFRNVDGAAGATAKQCLEQAWIGQATAANGAEDITRAPLNVVFALPSI